MGYTRKSDILNWTERNIDATPETSGVYLLRPTQASIGYIGMAGAGRLRARLKEHWDQKDHPRTAWFDWYQTASEADARQLEQAWIAHNDPPWNKAK